MDKSGAAPAAEKAQPLGQSALFQTCKAMSLFDKEVREGRACRPAGLSEPSVRRQLGYCQGMGFIAGILLMYMTDEVRRRCRCRPRASVTRAAFDVHRTLSGCLSAFCAPTSLCTVVREPATTRPVLERCAGMYMVGFPMLQQCFFQLERLMEWYCPKLKAHFDRESINVQMFATQWFFTVYAYDFPTEVSCTRRAPSCRSPACPPARPPAALTAARRLCSASGTSSSAKASRSVRSCTVLRCDTADERSFCPASVPHGPVRAQAAGACVAQEPG